MKYIQEYIEMVVSETIQKANTVFVDENIKEIPIRFDLTGKSAGMFCVRNTGDYFRFNTAVAELNQSEFDVTIIHEVAHYIAREVYGKVKPHGRTWKHVMIKLGISNPKRCHNYTMPKSKQRQTFTYVCDCQEHEFSKIRHNRSEKAFPSVGAYYRCNKCKTGIYLK